MKKLFALLGAAALLALSSSANAYTVSLSAGPSGELLADQITFEGISPVVYPKTAPGNGNFTVSGVVFSGTGIVVNNVVGGVLQGSAGVYAAPGGDLTNYMAVLGGQSETIKYGSIMDKFGLMWGSIDTYNYITFSNSKDSAVPSVTIGGSNLPTPPAIPFGDQSSPQSNEYVTISGLNFDTVKISSDTNSFEFDNVAAAAPEPATWAMMILGFAAIGFMAYRRKTRPAFGFS